MSDLDVKGANTAADETRQLPNKPPRQSQPNQKKPHHGIRAVVAVIAAVVIAFCAWSMSEYVNGRDPLAFLGSSTEAAQEESTSTSEQASDDASTAQATQLTSEEVTDHIANDLAFSGNDVTVPADDFKLLLKDTGVWVEQRSNSDSQTLVELTPERAAALASWLQEQGAQTDRVTWITEDVHGIIRVVVTDSLDAPTSGDTATLLAASEGYLISPETYADLGEVTYAATAGETPTLADGTEIQADTIYATDESGNVTGTTPVSSDQTSSQNSTGSSSSSTSARNSASSSSAAGSTSRRQSSSDGLITVTVSINGSSTTVSVPEGSTALDALRATGASVNAGANPYGSGTWVYGINGQDQGTSTSHGWTYTVNGTMPGVMSDLYVLSDGASVSWNFV